MVPVSRRSFANSFIYAIRCTRTRYRTFTCKSPSDRETLARMDVAEARGDKVILKGIKFEAAVGLDAWHRPDKVQPVELEVHLTPPAGLEAAAREDSVNYTIDYGKLYKALKAAAFDRKFDSVTVLYQAVRASLPEASAWFVKVGLPKGILAANHGVEFSWSGDTNESSPAPVFQVMNVRDLECRCIIGVNSHERLEKQKLQITITVWGTENRLSPSMHAGVSMDPSPRSAYQDMVKEVVEVSTPLSLHRQILTSEACRRLKL